MMSVVVNAFPPTLARFVHAVHRRQLALRVLERAGLGLLGGVRRCRRAGGGAAVARAGRVGGCGGRAGLRRRRGRVWGLADRPTPLAAAAEADRQLDLADLFATAWALRVDAGDARRRRPVSRRRDRTRGGAVPVAFAVGRAAAPPRDTRVGRDRAGGGVRRDAGGFVGPLAPRRTRRTADPRHSPSTPRATAHAGPSWRSPPTTTPARPAGWNGTPPTTGPLGNDAPDARPNPSPEKPNDARSTGRTDALRPARRPAPARGERGPERPIRRPIARPSSPDAQTPRTPHPPTPSPAAGAGRAAENPVPAQVTGGGTLSPTIALPPRTHLGLATDWPAAVQSARQAVQSGRVPDEYRDLVRGYFDASTPAPD